MSIHSQQNSETPVLEIVETKAADVPHAIAGSSARKDEESVIPAKSRNKYVLIAIVAVVVLAAGGYYLRNAFAYEETDDAEVQGHVMPLSARISGQVQQVQVVEGQLVHSGDVLLTIDPKDYQVSVDQARAFLGDAEATADALRRTIPIASASAFSGLDSTTAAVKNAEAGIMAAQENLKSAQAALLQAQANSEKSDADLSRFERLVQKEDISRQQYDQAVAAAKANRAAVVAADATVKSAEQALRQAEGRAVQARADMRNAQTAPEQVTVARARAASSDSQVARRKAELEQAELNLSYTIVRSPVTGIVGKKSVEIGQNVTPGQQLVSVVPLDDIWVTANFKETQLAHMRPGQPVDIKVDAYGRKWKGHVTNLGGGTGSVFSLLPPENATGNYVKVVQRVPVRIDFDRPQDATFNADGLLKPGLSVEPDVRVR